MLLWRAYETRLPLGAGVHEQRPVQRGYLEQQQSEIQRGVRGDRAGDISPCGDDRGRQREATASVRGWQGSEWVAGELHGDTAELRHQPLLCGDGQPDR